MAAVSILHESGEHVRRTRRHPRPTQFDYLHLRYLLRDLEAALSGVTHPVRDVLDIFCGARPYDDLLPAAARCVGLDVADRYGVADIVTSEFLPCADQSFDLVICTEGFHYVADPIHGVGEIRRVLRPGGTVVITVPLVWEYDRSILEHRYTGPELAALFEDWHDVSVVENGGRAVCWTTLTGWMADAQRHRLTERFGGAGLFEPSFAALYVLINGIGLLLDRIESRSARSSRTLPMNLLLTARRAP